MRLTTCPIVKSEFPSLIAFDEIHLRQPMSEIGVPTAQVAPPLTSQELEAAYNRKDILEWILVDNNLAGYFWFEKKSDAFYISGVAIKKEFQGQGIVQNILQRADKLARENYFSKCSLSVHPLNGPAMNVYLKHGYRVMNTHSSVFGFQYPEIFRLILEKELTPANPINFDYLLDVSCNDLEGLKNALNQGYIGIDFIRADKKKCPQNKIRFAKLL